MDECHMLGFIFRNEDKKYGSTLKIERINAMKTQENSQFSVVKGGHNYTPSSIMIEMV